MCDVSYVNCLNVLSSSHHIFCICNFGFPSNVFQLDISSIHLLHDFSICLLYMYMGVVYLYVVYTDRLAAINVGIDRSLSIERIFVLPWSDLYHR